MRILGIDPGLAIMGWGIIDVDEKQKMSLVDYGTITTAADMAFPNRLVSIRSQLMALLDEHKPDEIVFEQLFFNRNVTTAFTVGAARGIAICTCAEYKDDSLYEYTPMQIKLAVVGYGKAEKHQVQQMVKLILQLDEAPKPDDAADAVAVAIAHAGAGRARFQFRMN
ncbi:MAG TPA: crossover junction endodeoxyribonuclease RuvC [Christensenellaceae bacterium]|jgi:crossover junction endodeoxyribonuclease RuvC|nr:crossover junction endodeoxyribonuclease RuvC [Christensenellaceae bacterium]